MTSQMVREYIDGAYCIQHLNKSKSEMLKSGLSGTHAENRDRFIGLGQKIYYALSQKIYKWSKKPGIQHSLMLSIIQG